MSAFDIPVFLPLFVTMVNEATRNQAREVFKQFLQSVDNSVIKYRKDANTDDIIDTVQNAFPEAVKLTKEIAPYFTKAHRLRTLDPDLNTVFNVWRFLKLQINYQKDPPGRQDIRKPNFFVLSGKGDCKSYSLFAASVLFNLGFKIAFRYTAYRPGIPYKHVYVVAWKDGREYIIDGVYKLFNEEKNYIAVKTNPMDTYILGDVRSHRIKHPARLQREINQAFKKKVQQIVRSPKFQKMSTPEKVRYLANFKKEAQRKTEMRIGEINDEIGKLSKAQRKAKKAKRKAKAKKRNERIKRNLKKVGRGILTVGLGVGRGAFLAIVAMNLNGIASKMKKLQSIGKFKSIDEKWKNIGGITKLFHKAIDKGAKHKPLFLSKKAKKKFASMGLHGIADEGIGAIPVAAAAAAAVPVLAIILPLLAKAFKGAGMHKEAEQVEAGAESVKQETTPIIDNEIEQNGGNPENYEPEQSDESDQGEDGGTDEGDQDQSDSGDQDQSDSGDNDQVGDLSDLVGPLTDLAGRAVAAITTKIKKKNPKAAKVLTDIGSGIQKGIDQRAANLYLQQTGYGNAGTLPGVRVIKRPHTTRKPKMKNDKTLLYVALAGGALLAITRRK